MENSQTTIEDVLNAVNTSAELMQQQINEIKSTMATKDDIANMATKDDLANLVTKDYLDEKLADLRGDLVVLTRKEDTKLKRLVNIMTNKNMLSSEEKAEIFALEPFPETRL